MALVLILSEEENITLRNKFKAYLKGIFKTSFVCTEVYNFYNDDVLYLF